MRWQSVVTKLLEQLLHENQLSWSVKTFPKVREQIQKNLALIQPKMGCRLAREYHDRITLDFFGDQLVCHLAPDEIDRDPKMYPRHFGRTFLEKSSFDWAVESAKKHGIRFLEEPSMRFAERPEKHLTVAFLDPSNNVIEFKYYFKEDYIY